MSSGSNPSDQPKLLAMTIDQLSAHPCGCGCRCGCERHEGHAHEPFGREHPGHTGEAEKARAGFRKDLIKQAKELLATAQRALAEGATTADEIRDMQRLEILARAARRGGGGGVHATTAAAQEEVIVAVSHARDEHAPPVLAALRRLRERVVLLDLADFPLRGRIALEYGKRSRGATLETAAGALRADRVRAVWWRRPEPFDLGRGLSRADAAFSFRQALEALAGLAASLDARWVNDPWRDAAASHKPGQLALAGRLGLRVPSTLVTNDPDRARKFLARRGRTGAVHKTLQGIGDDWRPTRLVRSSDRARLDALPWAPVIFQEYVPGVDVRVTVVGDEVFAAEIDARETASPEDFRQVWKEARMAPCALPKRVELRLRRLVTELGLRYAAIDLRRRDDGEHVFLEVNPSGQWLFVEQRTGQPITAAVARLLAAR